MPVKERNGKWYIKFWIDGRSYSQTTDLVATERNKIVACRIETKLREQLLEGRSHELHLEIIQFNQATEQFLEWCEGEHIDHPNTTTRLRTSFASLLKFFGSKTVSSITDGEIDDYKSWRRTKHGVREVTIRHDLHALSKFYGYALRHNWARTNPVREVEIPSDADSVRMYILNREEEMKYFEVARSEFTIIDKKGIGHTHGPFFDLHDVARLLLLQGCRPEEVYNLGRADVDLDKGKLWVRKGKSSAAKRELQLLPESREILARRLAAPESVWMFPSPKLAGLPITKLNNSHEKVLTATSLSFVLYDLRHTFATRAAERGMPLPLLAKILGHANMRSVEKYVHPTQPALDEAMLKYGQQARAVGVQARREKSESGLIQ